MRMRTRRTPRLRGQTLNRLLPNILTILALCAGLSAIRFAIQERWEAAVIAVLIAAILDGLDGRVARLLKVQSNFGAQLDSLSDFVSFGVVPSTLLYLWVMQEADRLGWIAVLAFSVCSALRLARFNTKIAEPDRPPWASNYFTGVPMPGAAGLVLMPMMISFELDHAVRFPAVVVAVWTLFVSMMMVSRLPTFSMKGARIPYRYIVPVLLGVALLAASLVSQTWLTLTAIGIIYLASMPFSLRQYRRLERGAAAATGEEEEESADIPVLSAAITTGEEHDDVHEDETDEPGARPNPSAAPAPEPKPKPAPARKPRRRPKPPAN
ncbi:MAG: CDP-diacylglycerol--serine O-phosphatidyltransferase [Inquilinus sp.]|nr:CDP-diacylglycerol--serine O-phosphatidyltransferase [Inquilinus sp.]